MLTLSTVSKSLATNNIIDRIDAAFPAGHVSVIIGPNGAGKTTLLRLLAGLYTPDSGSMSIDAVPLVFSNEQRRQIGFLSEFSSHYDRLTLDEYLAVFMSFYHENPAEHRDWQQHLIEQTGLADCRSRQLGVFSRGMSQKVSLIRSLQHRPNILLLDEPTSTLDPESAVTVRDLIKSVSRRCHVLIASHNLDEICHLADDILLLKNGRVEFNGSLADFYRLLKNNITYHFEFETGVESHALSDYRVEIPRLLRHYYAQNRVPLCIEPSRPDLLNHFFSITGSSC